MNIQTQNQTSMGVRPKSSRALAPRQRRFIDLYLDSASNTFGNCYKSAKEAGFSDQTARNLTHNKPDWYSEIIGQQQGAEKEHLLLKLTDIMNNPEETTQNVLKAIDMLMKSKGMYKPDQGNTFNFSNLTIESVLD